MPAAARPDGGRLFALRAQRREARVREALARLPAHALSGTDADTVALRAEAFGIVPGQRYDRRATASGTYPYIGTVTLMGNSFAPYEWVECNGSLLPIAEYDTLFALIGTTYGGDGQTTFAVPDLRGRLPMGQGTGPGLTARVMGQSGGSETVTLTAAHLPTHAHAFVTADAATTDATLGNTPAALPSSEPARYVSAGAEAPMGPTTSAGGSQPHPNMPPFLAVRMYLCAWGIFPQRS